MAQPNDLVRARIGDVEKNVGRAYAESADDVEVLDEPVRNPDGSLRGETRVGGRPAKPRTTVAKKAAAKKASAAKKAAAKKTTAAKKTAATEPEGEPAGDEAVTEPADDQKEQDQ